MTSTRQQTKELVYIAFFAVLIAACSWLSVPTLVPFTMQTFAVFMTLILLGGKRGTISVCIYLLLGAIGAPVFAGFTGGFGVLFGSTGGYLFGFLAITLLYWIAVKHPGERPILEIGILILGLFLCYALGTIWFILVYTATTGEVGIITALWWCVIPYIIPDLVKLVLAYKIADRLRRHVDL